jgi:sec-independent protein translocase protein TatB
MLVVALIVVGPKDLPRLMNMAGKWASKARAMAQEFRKSFDEMARETELDELRKEIENLKKNNPIADMANSVAEMHSAIRNPVGAMMAEGTQEPAAPAKEIEPRSGELKVTDSTGSSS